MRLQLASAHTHTHARTDSGAYRLDSAEGVDVSSCDGGHGCSQSLCQLCDLSIVKWPANLVQIQSKWDANSVQIQCEFGHGYSQGFCQLGDLSVVKRPVNSVPIQFRCPATSV